ncbi:DUF4232 domain-containing protein [Streptomyces sp. GKU 257-1]|nr:DUF4232 domain-containing protein [Streptomyces sp. GKU 257-1]
MAPDADMTYATPEANRRARTAPAASGSPLTRRDRPRHPARAAATVATALVAAGLLAGCGGQDGGAPELRRVAGEATPAGIAASGKEKGGSGKESGSKDRKGDGERAEPSASSSEGSGSSADGGSGSGGAEAGGDGTEPGAGSGGACAASDLKASIGPNRPGAGQHHHALVFTNSSGSACTMSGFPGFAFVDASGNRVSSPPAARGRQLAAGRAGARFERLGAAVVRRSADDGYRDRHPGRRAAHSTGSAVLAAGRMVRRSGDRFGGRLGAEDRPGLPRHRRLNAAPRPQSVVRSP